MPTGEPMNRGPRGHAAGVAKRQLRAERWAYGLAAGTLLLLAGDRSAAAAPPQQQNPPQGGCNNQSQNSPAAQQRRCSQAVFNRLYAQVQVYCKQQARSCSKQTDTCQSATAKVAAGYGCTNARELVQKQCYRPGDPGYEGHMDQVAQANAALRKCIEVQDEKCP